ncbi:nucleosidase [Micromonospora profundi]|uniref:nucleosidase n=1 Tax=Micromonospora TaxID=1873 RepID=UPI0009EB6BBF|nr:MULTISPECIES: nucleosidase [Micromonospora]NJC12488.1 adenosylhomocysteine nucleosidase [Micromonospora profundi]
MNLRGTVRADRPLVVLAVGEEARYLPPDLPVLLTGIGKVNAASAVATVLAVGPRPSLLLNLGTAGALRPGLAGIHEIATVLQHDLDTTLLLALTGETYGAPLALATEGAVLATGDTFVADDAARDRLAQRADLVDMEGYAVAWAAAQAGVPCRLVKQVSDEAGEGAARTWQEAVDACARDLAEWAGRHLV